MSDRAAFRADIRRLIHRCRVQAIVLIGMIQTYRGRRPPPADWGPGWRMSPEARATAAARLATPLHATLAQYGALKLALRAADRRMPA